MHSVRETWFLLVSVPFYSILIGAEVMLSNWTHKGYYTLKDTLQNIYLTLVNAGLDILLRWAFYVSILSWAFTHHFFRVENVYAYWLLLFILEDFAFYIEHRIDHYCRVFWAIHVTHHSSEEFNLTTGFRSSVLQPLYRFIYFIPLAFTGFHPLDIVFMYSLTQTYGILVHTRAIKKMPRWFEAVFVSPGHHRVHHASNLLYLDKNMGMCLIVWDRLFGSFQEEIEEEPVRYGLTKSVDDIGHPVRLVFHEWQSIGKDMNKELPLPTRLKYLFMPPGWSHDGSSLTARQMRQQQAEGKINTKTLPQLNQQYV